MDVHPSDPGSNPGSGNLFAFSSFLCRAHLERVAQPACQFQMGSDKPPSGPAGCERDGVWGGFQRPPIAERLDCPSSHLSQAQHNVQLDYQFIQEGSRRESPKGWVLVGGLEIFRGSHAFPPHGHGFLKLTNKEDGSAPSLSSMEPCRKAS